MAVETKPRMQWTASLRRPAICSRKNSISGCERGDSDLSPLPLGSLWERVRVRASSLVYPIAQRIVRMCGNATMNASAPSAQAPPKMPTVNGAPITLARAPAMMPPVAMTT